MDSCLAGLKSTQQRGLEPSAASSNTSSIPTACPSCCDMLKACPVHKETPLHSLPALATTPGRRRDPRQGREPALRLRRLQGAGRRAGRLRRAVAARSARPITPRPTFEDVLNGEASRDHRRLHLRHRELGQSRPLGRGRRQAVRQPLRHLPAEIHPCREGSGDPRARRRGDPRRRRLRHRRRRVPAHSPTENGWTIISDTSWEGYESMPRSVMRGYCRAGSRRSSASGGRAPHACLRAGRRGRACRRGDRLSVGAATSRARASSSSSPKSADCWFQSNARRQAGAGQRQCRHGHGRPRLPRDLARDLAGGRPGHRLVHDHRGGPGDAGTPAVRPSAGRRSRDRRRAHRAAPAWPASCAPAPTKPPSRR